MTTGTCVATGAAVVEVTSVPFEPPVVMTLKPPVVREAVEFPESVTVALTVAVGWPSTPTVTVEVTVVVEV
jgi:hypothetical protein